jgi:hypothetical protein
VDPGPSLRHAAGHARRKYFPACEVRNGHPERVQRHAVTSTTNPVPRDPKDWQLQASNDGATWTALDTQNDQVFDYRLELKTYAIANPASYRYYRLNITANNGDSTLTDLAELGLFVSKP